MTDAETILLAARSVLVVDWPTKDLPETLARAGYAVYVNSGPEPNDYVEYTVQDDGSVGRLRVARPERVDIVHVFRPLDELPGFVELALDLGATAVWYLSGLAADGTREPTGCWLPADRSAESRRIVESAGLTYIDRPSILDAVRTAEIP
jgi:predicted CoA-binding protein